jgi:hypothetical protein
MGGDCSQVLLPDVLDAVAAGGRLQERQAERRCAAPEGLEQRQIVE